MAASYEELYNIGDGLGKKIGGVMQVNSQIFRAYDIRGLVDSDLSNGVATAIGRAFGTWLVRSSKFKGQPFDGVYPERSRGAPGGSSKLTVVVGRDNRFDSDRLGSKFIQGIISTGCDAIDIGLSVTPLVHFATIKYSVDAGVMVTASHNPKEFNGFRFDLSGAVPFSGRQIQSLRTLIESEDFEKGIGRVHYKETVFADYLGDLKGRIKIDRPLKVVVDCGNGAASKFAVELFEGLGLTVSDLYCQLDGDFPYHLPDPEERINLENLRYKVLEENADLGFALDTDADRFGLSDEKGNTYENDKVMVILARDVLKNHPGSRVLCDIKSSYVLLNEIRRLGGQPLMIKTGHPYFRSFLQNHEDVFLGGELSSHTFIKDGYYGYDDGLYAAARICQILSGSAEPLSQHFANLAHTAHTEEIKIDCRDERKAEIVNQVGLGFLRRRFDVSDVDGFRVNLSPTSWFLIRASNTGPYISLRLEAENPSALRNLATVLVTELDRFGELDLSPLRSRLMEKAHNV